MPRTSHVSRRWLFCSSACLGQGQHTVAPAFQCHALQSPDTSPSSLALSLQSVSVSFLVVFRNLISVFVAAFEFFVQVGATLQPRFPHTSHELERRDNASAWQGLGAFLQCCRWFAPHLQSFGFCFPCLACPHPVQGAALYAVGDAAAAAVKHTDLNVETSEVLSLRLFGYLLVAINLSSTFAYTIICKRALKKLELQATPP